MPFPEITIETVNLLIVGQKEKLEVFDLGADIPNLELTQPEKVLNFGSSLSGIQDFGTAALAENSSRIQFAKPRLEVAVVEG